MNIYSKKLVWKLSLILGALLIGIASLSYTNNIVEQLIEENTEKAKLIASATEEIANNDSISPDFQAYLFTNILQKNNSVPVIITDEDGEISQWRNLDTNRVKEDPDYKYEVLELMKAQNEPVTINLPGGITQKFYYKNSRIVDLLKYYPYLQLTIIALFIIVGYLLFSYSRNAEQNQVWVGLAKETAHQLGTPLSSLVGWVEYLKSTGLDETTYNEFKKDIGRLETITDRFSKIGSVPKLEPQPILQIVEKVVAYLTTRFSQNVELKIEAHINPNTLIDLNTPLFEWVIENLCKNSVDAMDGKGSITILLKEYPKGVKIEVEDTGKGIPKSQFKKVFKPGVTSKKRGWGLGLSLVKRIVEQYHHGKISVAKSDLGKGTTFRILLNHSQTAK